MGPAPHLSPVQTNPGGVGGGPDAFATTATWKTWVAGGEGGGSSVHLFPVGLGEGVKKEGGRERLSRTEPVGARFFFTLGDTHTHTHTSLKPRARSQTCPLLKSPFPPRLEFQCPCASCSRVCDAFAPNKGPLRPLLSPVAQALFLLGSRPSCLPAPGRQDPTRGSLSPRIGL